MSNFQFELIVSNRPYVVLIFLHSWVLLKCLKSKSYSCGKFSWALIDILKCALFSKYFKDVVTNKRLMSLTHLQCHMPKKKDNCAINGHCQEIFNFFQKGNQVVFWSTILISCQSFANIIHRSNEGNITAVS